MNNSQRTKDVAEGVMLWAAFMHLPGSGVDTPEWDAWYKWKTAFPFYVVYVHEKHDRMFDELNYLF